jgi:hypothetical protein
MATMYENVWIDSDVVGSGKVQQPSLPALPVVPPRYVPYPHGADPLPPSSMCSQDR